MRQFILALLPLLALVACNGNGETASLPTEIRIVTEEPTSLALQSTIDALETEQVVLIASSTAASEIASNPTATPTITPTPMVIGQGEIIVDEAVILTEPDAAADELGRAERGDTLEILGETEPDRIGVVFFQVRWEDAVGWVASTQVALVADSTPSPGVQPTRIRLVTMTPTPNASPTSLAPVIPAPTITPTPLPSGFPTPQLFSVVVVEQVFENGRMLWFEPNRQIWVLLGEEDDLDPTEGTWMCFDDTFVDGEPERDDTMDPEMGTVTKSELPDASIRQPIRGFGKIWRENPDVRERLGWALTAENMHTTRYEYHSGGEMIDGEHVPDTGIYRIVSLYKYTLEFTEDELDVPCAERTGTWQIK